MEAAGIALDANLPGRNRRFKLAEDLMPGERALESNCGAYKQREVRPIGNILVTVLAMRDQCGYSMSTSRRRVFRLNDKVF